MECDIVNMIVLLATLCCVGAVPMKNQDYIAPEEMCGYKSCHETKPGFLNVHIVPHTHDDVGWLKTVDQYYYGSSNNIQKAGVQYILDSVIKELWEDPKRRFIYVETAFFWKWWVRQSAATQTKVHTLVSQGRLQFVGGAWSMNDEAATHYQSTVDQFTWGLSKLNATFGPCGTPHVGWQIDPFGHSREFAALLAMMGYDGLFLGRLDYQDKGARLRDKRMEMVWRGDDDLGKSSDIFTGALYNTYSPPPGFCFDVLCNDEPIVDDPSSPIYNVESRISVFIHYVQAQARYYRTNNVVITMGGDFTYQDATMWYTNLDKLIRYTNLKAAREGLNVTLFYSTPDCYLKAVKDAAPILPTKQDDFFPYASDPNSYWTGYFTSRPTTKYFEREGNSYLQMVKQLQVLADLEEHNLFVLDELKSAMGVMQHHDAITGTEKQHVTHDYVRLLNQAIDDAMFIAKQAINKVTLGDASHPAVLELKRCHTNESSCDVSENKDNFIVTLYNPLGWSVTEPIRIPVVEGDYQVFGPDGKTIDTQLVKIPETVQNIPTRNSKATHEIVFIIKLKPLSYKNLYIKKIKKTKRSADVEDFFKNVIMEDYKLPVIDKLSSETNKNPIMPKKSKNSGIVDKYLNSVLQNFYNTGVENNDRYNLEDLEKLVRNNRNERGRSRMEFPDLGEEGMRMLGDEPKIVERSDDEMIFENEFFKVLVDKSSGIKSYTLPGQAPVNVSINMYYYTGAIGNNEIPLNRSSGAYIFRPTINEPVDLTLLKNDVVQGDIVTEIRAYLSPNGFINTRMYNNLYYLEVDWVVGPISIEDDIGKEYIIRYETNLINNGEFYTDSNGRSVLKRKLNYRPQWNVSLEEPIAGNYYPITNEIYIENDNDRVTVLPDRPEGGSSLLEGVVELMLHRRLLHDDAFGVGEALNETINNEGLVARGTQRVLFMKQDDFNKKSIISYHLKPHLLFSDATNINFNDYLKYNNEFSWLNKNLPNGLHLLTLEPWGDKLLLRLENYLSKSEFSDVEIDLSKLFVNFDIVSVRETMLAANVWVDEYKKWEWGTETEMGGKREGMNYMNGLTVKLSAKQIRTFIVDYEMK